MPNLKVPLLPYQRLVIRQIFEVAEMFGIESRNKYEVLDENQKHVAFVAEQQKGVLGFLMRQFLGHWRTFDIHFFAPDRTEFLVARHPFRFFFRRLEVFSLPDNRSLGAVQQRFSFFTKRFDVLNDKGLVIMQVSSPIWRMWTFPFVHGGREVALIQKKWTGLFAEAFTDKDRFQVSFSESTLGENERALVLASGVFIDLLYFEAKARR